MAIESVVVESVVSKITELLVEPVIKQFRYMFCFKNFVQEFDEQVMSLALAFYRVQDDVDVDKRNAVEINIDVNKWLEDAKNEMEGVNRLGNEKGRNGKCFTWCPKWIPQFKLSKALEKKTETLRKLEEKSKEFPRVSHKAPLQDLAFLPSKEFTPSESSKEAFEQIMKALKDDNVNMIGLYGMGGVGKTTLVEEVGRIAKESHLFDEVLLATVSQNPNVMYIQNRMAESLGLHFDEETVEGRAGRLWQSLKTKKKLLVILDDVWQHVELKEIGIPVGDAHRGCKVLLTTRLIGICSLMQCQQNVLLRILSENEAWALFKINAGLRDEDSNLNTVAKEVARECQGLPIALVTVGRALRGKSIDDWEFASTMLKNSQLQHMERIGEQKNAYACLKLSYDYLKHEETKLCFLLCCLFPEDYDISIEDLTRYAFGYGLYQDVESIEDARKQVLVAINTLKDCCMLLGTETEKKVKMHDLVRDVAIQIASKEHGFMVKAGTGLKEWPRSYKSFEGCTTISLMGNKLAKLPEELAFPQLKVLLLELDYNLNVPARFFEGMKEIEVLSLTGGCLSLQSLEFSTNLQSLLLISCECNDLIWLRKLQRLEILGFIEWSSLEELPDEIGELKELRLLDVTGCWSLGRIPVNLIGRLKKLEELLIGGHSFKGWDAVGCDSIEGTNAGLTELNSLSHLAVLSLKIPRVECIPRDFVFPRLLKYDIVLGDGDLVTKYPTSTRLYLHGIKVASLNAKTFEQLFPTVSQISFMDVEGLENIALSSDQMTSHGHGSQKDFFKRLEDVKVSGCKDIHTLFPAKWRQALNNLTSVEIEECESLEVVFELGEAGEGINVETLRINDCRGLKHLIREKNDEREIIQESLGFPKLKTLLISGCDKLEYVFPVSVSPSLPNLEEMTISFCANLKQIFYSGEGDGIINFPQLRNLSLKSGCNFFGPKHFTAQLPSLKVLAIDGHEELGDLLARLQGLTNLRTLFITSCKGAQHLMQAGSFVPNRRTGHEWWQALKNLDFMKIEECESLEEVFELGEAGEGINEENELLSSLTRLELKWLPELKCIWKGPTRYVSLQSLVHLELRSLNKLTFIFTPHLAQSLVHLETLQIHFCEELKHLIREKDDEREIIPESRGFQKLKTLLIFGCHQLEYVFPVSVSPSLLNLEEMDIEFGDNLKQIFYSGEGDALTRDGIIKFPQLRKLSLKSGCNFFGPKHFTAQFPSLQVLDIHGHEELGDLLAQLQGLTNLRTMSIKNCKGAQDRRTGHELSLLSLEKLELTSMPDMRCILKGLVLSHLTTLEVYYCHKLTHVFTGNMVTRLVQLQSLDISGCSELEQIIAKDNDDEKDQILSGIALQSLCFPNLRKVEIDGCNKLRSLFPVAMAAGLPKLQSLEVTNSSQLLGVFWQDDHASPVNVEKQMVLPNLSFLRLHSLPSIIVCFSLGCDDFLFPRMEDLMVDECPKLTTQFVQSEAHLQGHTNFREIHIIDCKGAQDRRTGHELSLLSLEKLHLSFLPDMRCIWKGLVPSHLTTLKVSYCEKLTHVFTGSMVASLVQLQFLRITACEELEQIIAKDNDDEKDQILSGSDLQSLCFPSLCKVEIIACDKLRSLFPVAMAAGLPKLQSLEVTNSSQLLGVFGKDDHASPVNVEKQMVFPDLSFLRLYKLPSIVCFSLGCDDFLFPRMEDLEVDECPKLTTKFANKTNVSMSAQSEASQSS